MRSEFKWFSKNGRIMKSLLLLFIMFAVYTFSLVNAVLFMQSQYGMANMQYETSNNDLYLFYAYSPYAVSYSPVYWIVANLLIDFIIPLILAFFFVDINFKFESSKLSNVLIIKTKKYYVLRQFLSVFISSFAVLFVAIIVQGLLGIIVNEIIKPFGNSIIPKPGVALELVYSNLKVSLYFASLTSLGFSVSLYLGKLFPISYVIPMAANVILVLAFPSNVPSKLGFIDDGLSQSNQNLIWLFISAIFLVSLIMILPKVFRKDEI